MQYTKNCYFFWKIDFLKSNHSYLVLTVNILCICRCTPFSKICVLSALYFMCCKRWRSLNVVCTHDQIESVQPSKPPTKSTQTTFFLFFTIYFVTSRTGLLPRIWTIFCRVVAFLKCVQWTKANPEHHLKNTTLPEKVHLYNRNFSKLWRL